MFLFCTGNEKIAELLINAGIDLNSKGEDELTPFHMSAMYGTIKIADLLIKAKAKLNEMDAYDYTPYQRAMLHLTGGKFDEMLRNNGKIVVGSSMYIEDDNRKLINAVSEGFEE